MSARPSEPLLRLIRETAQKKGMNTAALARAAQLDRARLKHVLAGSEPLMVDEFIQLSQALELGQGDLAGMKEPEEQPAPRPSPVQGRQAIVPDPFGNHAEQALRLGYALGADMFLLLDSTRLEGTGIPAQVRQQFPDRFPIRLDAAFHMAQDPRFLPEGLQLNLSFDALYTVVLPWSAFVQVSIIPLPPEPVAEPTEPEPSKRRGHLRLVE